MKRPFAVMGFTMLLISLPMYMISVKMTAAVFSAAAVIFCVLLFFKESGFRKTALFALAAVLIFAAGLLLEQYSIFKNSAVFDGGSVSVKGTVVSVPASSDYAFSYIIKVESGGEIKGGFKLRYITTEKAGFAAGDKVSGTVSAKLFSDDIDYLEYSLASKVYFTCFESDGSHFEATGEESLYYKTMGSVRKYLSDTVDRYIPGENGAVAKAMTIGDKSGISDKTLNYFNYSGTAHLLVVSGLHLTVWAMAVMRLLSKSRRTRKYAPYLGGLCVLFYCALTGFSVSIVRAGIMTGCMLLGRALGRDSDSLNSIGLSVIIIFIINPFSAFSAAMWLTVLSTSGIVLFSEKINDYIEENNKSISHLPFFHYFAETFSVSAAATLMTLPVFILKFDMLPVLSFISNFFMVQLGMLLMIISAVALFMHAVGLTFAAEGFFTAAGLAAKLLRFAAEKIGMSNISTVTVNHKAYLVCLAAAAAAVPVMYLLFRKGRKAAVKAIAKILSLALLMTFVFCTAYELNTPSLEFRFSGNKPTAVIKAGFESALIGGQDKTDLEFIEESMSLHNIKEIDCVCVIQETTRTPSFLMTLHELAGKKRTVYVGEETSEDYRDTAASVTIGQMLKINTDEAPSLITFDCREKCVALVNGENAQKAFENNRKYDIIILYGNFDSNDYEYAKAALRDSLSQLLTPDEEQRLSLYF